MPTNNPWDGTAWDITAPDIDQLIGNHYKEMFDLRKGVGIRIDKEHITLATSSAGGEHVQGSARAWFQDAVPALQPDGTALAATDNGMLWFDTNSTPDNLAYVLVDHSDPTVGNGWVLLSTSIFAEMVLLAHQWAAVQTFDLQTVHTLGILSNASITLGAGADLVGAADSVINMNAFDVTADGNVTAGGTLEATGLTTVADGSLTKTTAAPTTDAMIANKKYVDDERESDVNGSPVKVFTKYITGSLDNDSSTLVAHGIASAISKILSVSSSAFGTLASAYVVSDFNGPDGSGTSRIDTRWDATNVQFQNVGTSYQGNSYKIKIDYVL